MSLNTSLLLGILTLALACGGRGADAGAERSATGSLGGMAQHSNGGIVAASGRSSPVGGAESAGAASTPKLVPIDAAKLQGAIDSACEGYSVESESKTQSVQWLVDASTSMAEPLSETGKVKWEMARNAVEQVTSTAFRKLDCIGTSFGMLAFPGKPTDDAITLQQRPVETCIDLTRELTFGDAPDEGQISAFLDLVQPQGGTPLLDAYRRAVSVTKARGTVLANIILVTDGMPTMDAGCINPPRTSDVDDYWHKGSGTETVRAPVEPIVKEIELARAEGIHTHVLGLTDSATPRPWLSKAAIAGGTARAGCDSNGVAPLCHYDMSTEATAAGDLATALRDDVAAISAVQVQCKFEIPEYSSLTNTPIDPSRTSPFITTRGGQTWAVLHDDGPAELCSDGFRIVDGHAIELCPAACALLQSDCLARVQILFGCDHGGQPQPLI